MTIVNFCVEHKESIAYVLFYVFSIGMVLASAVRQKLNFSEAMILLVNTLKDETKMESDGKAFSQATVTKIDQVAQATKAGATAISEAKAVITTVNTRDITTANPGDLKIGSYKGKPVFLSDATAIGSKLAAALGVLRGIIRK